MSKYVIETKNLTKQYGTQKSVADLNIHVQKGRIYGLLGRNGAGKTTTMKMLLGLTQPTSGEVTIWGKPLAANEKKLLPRIGSLIESPGFYPNLTATENLRIFATLRGVPNRNAIKNALDLVGLPYKDKKLFSQYSLGMKQRLAIALAVMHDPELLILDEPINGLDPIGIAEVRSFIRDLCNERGKTILISSHILSEIALLADDIGIIDHGVLLEEESLTELEAKSSKHIRFTVSDTAQAARILERIFHENQFTIQDDHNMRLHNLDISVGKIVTAFVENELEVSQAYICEESLEDYFKRVTGGVRGLLKLVKCEFWKLKRKGLFKIALFTSVLFPVFYAMLLSDGDFADFASVAREESGFLLLIPILVMIAANLFFEEHDNDTLKNLVCVPVLKSRLVMAKVIVLVLFSVVYELAGFCISVLLAITQGISLNGLGLQLFLTLCTGILLWAAALPCIILVVWCNKSYIISVIIAFFYTLLGYALHLSDAIMMKPLGLNISTFIPVPIIFRWLYQFKVPEGKIMTEFYNRLSPYFISTPVIFLILVAEAVVCIALVTRVYQKQEV